MSSQLCLHSGALSATRQQVDCVETPPATDSWFPIPHSALIYQTIGQLEAANLRVESDAHGMSSDAMAAHYREQAQALYKAADIVESAEKTDAPANE